LTATEVRSTRCSALRLRGPCPSATLRLRSGRALRGREVEGQWPRSRTAPK